LRLLGFPHEMHIKKARLRITRRAYKVWFRLGEETPNRRSDRVVSGTVTQRIYGKGPHKINMHLSKFHMQIRNDSRGFPLFVCNPEGFDFLGQEIPEG